jgi:hypothetical protein
LVEHVLNPSERQLILANLAPKKAVKVGESWTLDPKTTFAEAKDFKAVLDKTTITAKLTKVYQKGTVPFGIIEYQASIPISQVKGYLNFDPPATSAYKGTIDIALDGSSTEYVQEFTEEIDGKGKTDAPEFKGRIELKGGGKARIEVSAEKDDAQARNVPKVTWVTGPKSWTEFTSKEHAFKAMFPGKPQVQTTKDARGYPTTQYIVGAENGAIAYIVAVTEFPGDANVPADDILKGLEMGQDIKEKKTIRMNGFPGREFLIKKGAKDKEITITQRVYVVKQRLYQALYVESEGKKGDLTKFFEGFNFNDKQAERKDD